MARTIIVCSLPPAIVLFMLSWLVAGAMGSFLKVVSVSLLVVLVVAMLAQVRR